MKKYLSKGICIIIIITMVILSSCSNGSSGGSSGGSSNIPFKGKKVNCSQCGGSGLCNNCKGVGYFVINPYFGTTADCASCYSGECRRCDGRGWLLK